MNYPIFKVTYSSASKFTKYWAQFYNAGKYPDTIYEKTIGEDLTEEKILLLFTWKNGTPLSEKKKLSIISNYIEYRRPIPTDPNNAEELNRYLRSFTTTIWPIFWLHCNHPSVFPIFDQHVHRAMHFILHQEIIGDRTDREKRKAYVEEYIPFFSKFTHGSPREADKALMAFGQFLKTNGEKIFKLPKSNI